MGVLGNRGLCAGPCRLPYTLIDESEREYDKGYLLSPRDLMGASSLPALIKAGVSCFKIEGRLKNPEYVGIVTRYYRKLIDLVYNNLDESNETLLKMLIDEENKINPETSMSYLEELKQSFNRGGFSNGHFSPNPNKELIYKEMASNTGFYLGKVQNFKPNKGYITLKLEHSVGIGDKVSVNSDNYTISELISGKNDNLKLAKAGDVVTIGRIKGNIKPGQKIFKLQSKILNEDIAPTFKENKEFKKIKLNTTINIKSNQKISMELYMPLDKTNENSVYYNKKAYSELDYIPEQAQKAPATKESIISQVSKTGNTPYEFENIKVNLDENLFVPVKVLNQLRRITIENLQNQIIEEHINSKNLKLNSLNISETSENVIDSNISKIQENVTDSNTSRNITNSNILSISENIANLSESSISENMNNSEHISSKSICLLLNILDENINYNNYINGIDNLYIPLKYFILNKYASQVIELCQNYNVYVYMPNIIRDLFKIDYDKIVNNFNIKGFVISSLSQIEILKKYNLEMIGNYNLNIYNKFTTNYLKQIGLKRLCITPELNDFDTKNVISNSSLPLELWAYGRIPLMTMNYCLLGKSNKCYKDCIKLCESNKIFYLKDRLDFKFRILPDNFWNLTKIYNSKITSFDYSNFNVNFLRINILDESPDEIKTIISNIKNNIPFKGNNYCGHFNKSEN